MQTKSKYYPLLKPLLRQSSFTAAEARKLGIPTRTLAYLVKRGILKRLDYGIYRSSDYESEVDITLEGLVHVASTVPNAIICLISALNYYHLTDELPREHWIAIPHAQYVPKRRHARIIQMRNTILGRQQIQLGEYKLMIFDRERCIIDAFRYLSREVAIKALREYLGDDQHKPNLSKLSRYAKALRTAIKPYILALTA